MAFFFLFLIFNSSSRFFSVLFCNNFKWWIWLCNFHSLSSYYRHIVAVVYLFFWLNVSWCAVPSHCCDNFPSRIKEKRKVKERIKRRWPDLFLFKYSRYHLANFFFSNQLWKNCISYKLISVVFFSYPKRRVSTRIYPLIISISIITDFVFLILK